MSYQDLSRAIAEEKEYMEEWRNAKGDVKPQSIIDHIFFNEYYPQKLTQFMSLYPDVFKVCQQAGISKAIVSPSYIYDHMITGMAYKYMLPGIAESFLTRMIEHDVLQTKNKTSLSSKRIRECVHVMALGKLRDADKMYHALSELVTNVEQLVTAEELSAIQHKIMHNMPHIHGVAVHGITIGTRAPALQYFCVRDRYSDTLGPPTKRRVTVSKHALFRVSVEPREKNPNEWTCDIDIPISLNVRLPSGKLYGAIYYLKLVRITTTVVAAQIEYHRVSDTLRLPLATLPSMCNLIKNVAFMNVPERVSDVLCTFHYYETEDKEFVRAYTNKDEHGIKHITAQHLMASHVAQSVSSVTFIRPFVVEG